MDTVDELLEDVSSEGRVCPMPDRWNRLWEMLLDGQVGDEEGRPPVPLILGGWDSPDRSKRKRLAEYVRYAHDHGMLERVSAFLHGLNDEAWHYESPGWGG